MPYAVPARFQGAGRVQVAFEPLGEPLVEPFAGESAAEPVDAFVTFSPACRGGGFLLKNPSGFSIDRLSPHALWFARFMSRATR